MKKGSFFIVALLLFRLDSQPAVQDNVDPNISFLYGQNQRQSRIEAIGSWFTVGQAHFDQKQLNLLDTSDKDSHGKAFFKQDIATTSWSVQIELDLSAIDKKPNDQWDKRGGMYPERGFAFWHLAGDVTQSTFEEFGPIFGHQNNYKGVGIFFYNRRMKEIMVHARVNNGEEIQEIQPQMNRFKNSCIQKVPDKQNARFLIQNTPQELKVSVWQKNRWKGCLNNREVAIKGPGYIGVSATNFGIVSQFVTIKSFEFTNEDPTVNMSYIRRPSVYSKMAMSKSRIKKEEFDASKVYLIDSMIKKYILNEKLGTEPINPPSQQNPYIQNQVNAGQAQPPQTPPPTQNQNQASNQNAAPPPTPPPASNQPPPPIQTNQAQNQQTSQQVVGNQASTQQQAEIPNPYSEQEPPKPVQTEVKSGFSLSESDYNNLVRSVLTSERKILDLQKELKEVSNKQTAIQEKIKQELKVFANQIKELNSAGDKYQETKELKKSVTDLEKSNAQTRSQQNSRVRNLEMQVNNLKNQLSIMKYSKKEEPSGGSALWIVLIVVILIGAVVLVLYLKKARGERTEGGSKFHLP